MIFLADITFARLSVSELLIFMNLLSVAPYLYAAPEETTMINARRVSREIEAAWGSPKSVVSFLSFILNNGLLFGFLFFFFFLSFEGLRVGSFEGPVGCPVGSVRKAPEPSQILKKWPFC